MSGQLPSDADDPNRADPKAVLRNKLGHDRDAGELIERFLRAVDTFESGDNRAATIIIRDLLKRDLSPELRNEARALLVRIQPDRQALVVLVLCVVGLIVVWILATR